MKRKNRELICIIVGILLVMALLIFLYRQDSDTGRHEDNNESEPTPTVEVETEPTETPVFGVSEGQIAMDIDEMMMTDEHLAGVCRVVGGYETLEVVSHDYDEASQIDNARMEYWFKTWFGRIKYSKQCSYQYSKDSGLWEFLSGEESEIEDIQYDEDTMNSLIGNTIDLYYGFRNRKDSAVLINTIEISGWNCYMDISYGFDRGGDKGWVGGDERVEFYPQLAERHYTIHGWISDSPTYSFELSGNVTKIDEYGNEAKLYIEISPDEMSAHYYD